MGSLQVEFGSSELGNNAIMKFHTDTVISHCVTEHNITTNSMEHSASWEVERRSALQSSVSFIEPEFSLQYSQQRKARWISSHIPISLQPFHQRLGLVSGYFRIPTEFLQILLPKGGTFIKVK